MTIKYDNRNQSIKITLEKRFIFQAKPLGNKLDQKSRVCGILTKKYFKIRWANLNSAWQ
jgi:hypothetical protein